MGIVIYCHFVIPLRLAEFETSVAMANGGDKPHKR